MNELKKIRLKKLNTMQEVANLLGCSRQYIEQVENEKIAVSEKKYNEIKDKYETL